MCLILELCVSIVGSNNFYHTGKIINGGEIPRHSGMLFRIRKSSTQIQEVPDASNSWNYIRNKVSSCTWHDSRHIKMDSEKPFGISTLGGKKNYRLILKARKIIFSKKEHTNWPANTKCSALKSYTYIKVKVTGEQRRLHFDTCMCVYGCVFLPVLHIYALSEIY